MVLMRLIVPMFEHLIFHWIGGESYGNNKQYILIYKTMQHAIAGVRKPSTLFAPLSIADSPLYRQYRIMPYAATCCLWSPYGIGQTIIFSCCSLLWPPCVADANIIFLPCGFCLLWSPYVTGQTIYIFILSFVLSFFFFSSLNLSGRRLDVCDTSTHGVALVRI